MAATAPSNSHPHHLHLYFVTRLRCCGVGGGQESDRNADGHVIVLSKRSGLFTEDKKEVVLLRARGLAWKPTQRREHGHVMCSKVTCVVLLQMQHSVQQSSVSQASETREGAKKRARLPLRSIFLGFK